MNWQAIKQLYSVFTDGQASSDILKYPLVKRLVEMDYVRQLDRKIIIKTKGFDPFYVNTFLSAFRDYEAFLSRHGLLNTNFHEDEIKNLLTVEKDVEIILKKKFSQKEISSRYFKDAKLLRKGSRLFEAVIKILGVETLARDEHDQQYLYVLHCKNIVPKAIILCENDNKLRKPRLDDIELWHAGGRNTAKLQFIKKPDIPIYYLCDWDNKGMEIYQDIKSTIFPQIELVVPQEPIQTEEVEQPWTVHIDEKLFNNRALRILERLRPNWWIEEETINHLLFRR